MALTGLHVTEFTFSAKRRLFGSYMNAKFDLLLHRTISNRKRILMLHRIAAPAIWSCWLLKATRSMSVSRKTHFSVRNYKCQNIWKLKYNLSTALNWLESYFFHVALHDLGDEGNFKWCKGNYSLPLRNDSLLKFYGEKPDNWGPEGEQCTLMMVMSTPVMALIEVTCDYPSEYICEVNNK